MTQIVVTGGSGKAGRAVVRDLVEHGLDVVNVDVVPADPQVAPFLRAASASSIVMSAGLI